MKKISMLFVLVFIAFTGKSFAQTCSDLSAIETPPTLLSAGNTVTLQYKITNNNTTAGFAAPLTTTLHLPMGISFSSLNIVGTTSGITTASTAGSTDPVFTLPAIAASGSVTISIRALAPCAYDALRPAVTAMDFSNTLLSGCTYTVANNMTLQTGNMIVSIASNTMNLNMGNEQDLAFEVSNGGPGIIPSFDVACSADPTTTILGYCVSTTATPCAGTPLSVSGGTIHVSNAELQALLPPNGLGQGQTVFVHIRVKVVNCNNSGGGLYTFSWGNPVSCQPIIPMNTDINVVSGTPVVAVTALPTFTSPGYCPGGVPAQMGFIYKNNGVPQTGVGAPPPGNAVMTNLTVHVTCDVPFGTIDPASFRINGVAIPAASSAVLFGFNVYTIDLSALPGAGFGAHPFGMNTLDDLDADGNLDDLLEGNSFTLTFDFAYPTTCPTLFATAGKEMRIETYTKFRNQCGAASSPTDPHGMALDMQTRFGRDGLYMYASSDQGSTITAPPDVVAGTGFPLQVCANTNQQWSPANFTFNCPNGHHQFRVVLPPGYHLAPGVTTISIPLTNPCSSTPVAPVTATVTEYPAVVGAPAFLLVNPGQLPAGNCSTASISYDPGCFSIPMSLVCTGNSLVPNFGFDELKFTYEYICDDACSTCIERIGGDTTVTYHHCNGNCDLPFNTVQNTMDFHRRTLGAFNPAPGYYTSASFAPATQVPATSPIDLRAAYPGDAIEMHLDGGFTGTNGFDYESMFLQLRYDRFLPGQASATDIFIQDPDIPSTVEVTSAILGLSGVYPLTYVFTPPAPNDEVAMNFEFPPALLPMLTSGDVHFRANINLIARTSPHTSGPDNTFFTPGPHPVQSLRAEFGGAQIPPGETVATDSTFSCDSWGALFTMLQPRGGMSMEAADHLTDCTPYVARVTFSSTGALWGAHINDFPNEFRPYAVEDDHAVITLPPGYDYVSSTYEYRQTPSAGPATNNFGTGLTSVPLPASPVPTPGLGGTTILTYNGLGSSLWPLLGMKELNTAGGEGVLNIVLQPHCDAPASANIRLQSGYTESFQQRNPAYMIHRTVDIVRPIFHVNPTITVTGPPTVNALSNNLDIDFTFCNSNGHTAPNTWISLTNPSGIYSITGLTLLPSMTVLPVVAISGGILVNTGNIPPSTCLNMRLTGTITTAGCGSLHDEVLVNWGNECSAPVTANTETLCSQGSTTFGFNTFPSTITLTPAVLNGFPTAGANRCGDSLAYNFVIENPSQAFVGNPQFWMDLPAGINFSSAAFTYPLGQPGATTVTSTATTTSTPPTTGFGTGGIYPGWNLYTLFPAAYPAGLAGGLSGTTSLNNKVGVTINVKPDCEYNNLDYLKFHTGGTSACSEVLSALPQQHLPTVTSGSCCAGFCEASAGSNITICENSSATLTASGGSTGYSWSPGGATTAIITVTPSATTTYTVTASNGATSCTATVTVNVDPAPDVAVTASSSSLCKGRHTTLTATGADTYTWVASAGANPSPGNIASVTPLETTTYTVTGTNTTTGCTNTAEITITVYPVPVITVSASPNPLCAGSAAVLTASGALAGTYNWTASPGPNPSGTAATVTVSPAVTTSYHVTGAGEGGCTGFADVTVEVIPAPTITIEAGKKEVCEGQSILMTASGAVTYSWQPMPSGTPHTGTSVTVSPTVTTTYVVTGTAANGCTNTASVTITVKPVPVVTVTPSQTICSGTSATLTAGGADTYNWTSSPSSGVTTGNPITVSPVTTTTYTVNGDVDGCSSTAVTTVTVTNVVVTAPVVLQPCPGTSITITATGNADSYSWTVPPSTIVPGASLTVTPPGGITSYTVTGTLGACSATATTLVQPQSSVITLTASPAIICAGSGSTLTASTGTGYSWTATPGPAPTGGPSVVVTPTVTTVYTLTQTSASGCSYSKSVTVTVKPKPTVTITGPTSVCKGTSVTLTASGTTGNTYTWTIPPATSIVASGASPVFTPTVTTTYMVTASLSGCATTATYTVTVNPLPTVTLSASPTSICPGQSSTLTASTGISYTWTASSGTVPSGGPAVVMTPTVTTTYTLTQTSAEGCTKTATVTVSVKTKPTITVTAVNPNLCAGASTTLLASGLGVSGYTWSAGTTPSTGNPVTVSPTSTTVYTVTGTGSNGCTATTPVTVNVIPPLAVTLTSGSDTVCIGQSTTLTASSPGTVTYSWTGGAAGTSATSVVEPTVNTVYTVTVTNQYGCTGTATITVYVKNCGCEGEHFLPASADTDIISATPASNIAYVVPTNVVISGSVLFRDISVQMGSGVKITVPATSTLTIEHSHLWACDQMWQGIVVESGGKLIIKDASLIEDAIIAVNVATTTFTAPANMALVLDNSTFNKNFVCVNIRQYQQFAAAYPYSITGTVFTNRAMLSATSGYDLLTAWPTPSDLKVLYNTGTLSEQYINSTTYPLGILTKAPHAGQPSLYGIVLNDVGNTNSSGYYGIQLGATSGTSPQVLNLYDNLVYGIYASNSNFTSYSSVYQKMVLYGPGNVLGGGIYGICENKKLRRAVIASPAVTVTTVPGATGTIAAYSNEFYNAHRAVDLNNYAEVIINAASVRSDVTSALPTSNAGGRGYMGFSVTSKQYKNIQITSNRVTNINNGIVFKADAPDLLVTPGPVNIDNNLVQADYTSPTGTGHWILNGIAATGIVSPLHGSSNVISTSGNTLTNVYNGIATSYWTKQSSVSINNLVYMVAPGTTAQYGISHANNDKNTMRLNTVIGVSPAFTKEACIGIYSWKNSAEVVSCNTVMNVGHGIEFGQQHTGVMFMNNVLDHCTRGYVLSNSAVIGLQTGPSSTATPDNRWTGSWSGLSQTYVINSYPLFSRLQLRSGALYTPVSNGHVGTGSAYVLGSGPVSNMINVSSPGPLRSCLTPVPFGCTGCMIADLEPIVLDSVPYAVWPTQSEILGKHQAYRLIHDDTSLTSGSPVLATFDSLNATSSIGKLAEIEADLAADDYSSASAKLSTFIGTNSVERNYKTFYGILAKHIVDTLITPLDSGALYAMATGCPDRDGAVVIQARALMNILCNCYETYEDNCPEEEARSIHAAATGEKQQQLNYLIYPNPAKEEVYISVSDVDLKEAIVEVCDITGKRVMMKKISLEGGIGRLELDVQNGVYFISIDDVQKHKVFTQKIIIAK